MKSEERARINTLKWLLVDAIYDLVAAVTTYRDRTNNPAYDPTTPSDLAIVRMCNAHIIISLSKLQETLGHFGKDTQTLPPELKERVNRLRGEIKKRPVLEFRNAYVAHAFEKSTTGEQSLMPYQIGQDLLEKIVGSSLDALYDWVSPEGGSASAKDSVVRTITALKDYCRERCPDARP